jgi:predicted Zn-dependent protease
MEGNASVESELLTHAQCSEIFETAARTAHASGVTDVEVLLGATESALTRFANNAIHQNVAEQRRFLSVRVILDRRTARATVNRFSEEAIRQAVEQAVEIARSRTADPDLPPLAEPAEGRHVNRYYASTAAMTPRQRAEAVAEAISLVHAATQTAAGIFSTGQSVEAILNSRGLSGYYLDTQAQFSITAMADDSPRSHAAPQARLRSQPVPAMCSQAATLSSSNPRQWGT